MSFKVEIQDKINNEWVCFRPRFATEIEAIGWRNTLCGDWFGETRITYSTDPIYYPPEATDDDEGGD
jgi:hypothetical protein